MAIVDNQRKGYVEVLSEGFEKLGGWSYDNRWIVFALSVLLVALSTYYALGVRFDNSFEAFFDKNDPTYRAFLQYREDFGSDEVSIIVYKAQGYEHGPWNLDVMGRIKGLTKIIEEEVPFVKQVTSLANVEFIEGGPGGIVVRGLLEAFPETQEDLLRIRDKFLQKPIYKGLFVGTDPDYAAILVEMEKSSIDSLEEIQYDPAEGNALDNLFPQITSSKINEVLGRPEYEGIEFFHSGDVPLNAWYNTIIQNETIYLGAVSLVVIGVILALFFRRAIGVVGPLSVVSVAFCVTVGFLGFLGWDFDLMFPILPTMLMVVGVADAVHLITEFNIYQRRLGDRKKALMRAIYLVGVPCLFTTLTTATGFASLSISPIKSLKHFAIYTAFGVCISFLFTMTILVFALTLGRSEKKQTIKASSPGTVTKDNSLLNRFLRRIADFNIHRYKSVLACSVLVYVFFIFGLAQLKVDSNWLSEFSEELKIRQDTEVIDRVMGGTAEFCYIFNALRAEGILDLEVLKRMEALQVRAEQETDIVMKTSSIVDLIKDINQSFHDGDPKYYTIPDNRDLIAQYLLVYEMSGGDEIYSFISSDHKRANLSIRSKLVAATEYTRLVDTLDAYLAGLPKIAATADKNGIGALWMKLIDYIVESQIKGFLLAFLVISVMMCILFKSVRIGLLAMIPNLAPVFVALGLMGWLHVTLDYTKLLIGCVAIGIAVDDTIHLITRFRHEFFRKGNYEEALKVTMTDVGRALFITSVVLVSGFLVLLTSTMDSTMLFGMLLAVAVSVALIADFFLMPALVLLFHPFGPEEKVSLKT